MNMKIGLFLLLTFCHFLVSEKVYLSAVQNSGTEVFHNISHTGPEANLPSFCDISDDLCKMCHHPFYVSVTDAHYKPESRSVEIAQKIFWDDLESVLSQKYKSKVDLKKGMPLDMLPEWIREYTLSHHLWKVNDKPCGLEFVGYEIEEDVIWIFLQVRNVETPVHILVGNSMLTDFLPGQKNITHVYIGDRTLSVITDKKNPSGELQF
jgi:hypothetical protein